MISENSSSCGKWLGRPVPRFINQFVQMIVHGRGLAPLAPSGPEEGKDRQPRLS